MARNVVIQSGCLYMYGSDKEVYKLIKDCGFTHFDISLYWKNVIEHIGTGPDYLEKTKALKEYTDSLGLVCEQAHAYFTNGIDEETLKRRNDYIKQDIEVAALMGAKGVVIHCILEYNFEQNIEWFKQFIPLAHKYNIKLLVENTWGSKDGEPCAMITSTPEGIVKFIDTLNDEYVGACLDVGHAEMKGCGTCAVDMIHALGKRLKALHLHDVDQQHDNHQMPFTHRVPFISILDALKEEQYEGDITFEVESCYHREWDLENTLPKELFPAFVKLEYEIGKYFADYLDK